MGKCFCGQDNCWDDNDFSWLSSHSGWHGIINDCQSSVFFIHGKHIREQRYIPYGYYPISNLQILLDKWSEGLPNARMIWSEDTGGGECGLWIEGERNPNEQDLERLKLARENDYMSAKRDLKSILSRYPNILKE